ncbi:protein broad-minded-like [Clytia hemisphaerica]|uniref:BROMI C-terminal Rab TBC-like domain-containing protein n=1 Tax=Clytia hemisphaerica TaxID=252671 RepID=A0A7M5XQA3_9CNID
MQTSSPREIESQKSSNERSPKKKSLLRMEESVAIDMLVRYGLSLRRLSSQDECTERLKKLLSIMKNHWSTKGHVMEYKGFDWLMGILFLIFKGDEGRTFGVLKSLSTHEDASFIWPSLAMVKEQALHVDAKLFHWIEYILERELPHVSAAFRISGLPPSQICQLWRQQCFLNFLNFQDIQLFIVMCLTMGHDFHVYFMLSLFRHSKRDILQQSQEENLLLTLRTMPFNGYQLHEHVDFFLEIQEKYSSDILNDFL